MATALENRAIQTMAQPGSAIIRQIAKTPQSLASQSLSGSRAISASPDSTLWRDGIYLNDIRHITLTLSPLENSIVLM